MQSHSLRKRVQCKSIPFHVTPPAPTTSTRLLELFIQMDVDSGIRPQSEHECSCVLGLGLKMAMDFWISMQLVFHNWLGSN